jgi:hypothetical protein
MIFILPGDICCHIQILIEYLTVLLRYSWIIQFQIMVLWLYQSIWDRVKYLFYTQVDEEITVVAVDKSSKPMASMMYVSPPVVSIKSIRFKLRIGVLGTNPP